MTDAAASQAPMDIDYVADVVCPWCYIGWSRLLQTLALRPGVEANIRWRPYQLNPELPEEGVDRKALMASKFGSDPERMRQMSEHLEQQAAAAGLQIRPGEVEKSPNTNAAHRLIVWAGAEGKAAEVAEAVMHAYWTELKDIGDPEVLIEIGAAHGMDRDALARRFADGSGKAFVTRACETAMQSGIQGVPFMIFADKVAVSGAHPPDQLVRAIDKALEPAGG
ncbi:MAG TPA: DsbA family oxidoreductase [Caulobacteraceae bacterium]|jgi:predicted DsbA family dithiol-disulfide isomerase